MLIYWFCYVGAHSFVRSFLLDVTWTVVIYGQKEDITKMVKLLACFIEILFHREILFSFYA